MPLRVRGSHPLSRAVPCASARFISAFDRSFNPVTALLRLRFGLLPVRSPLLGESWLLSFPAGTKMFQFPAFASASSGCRNRFRRVAPFGHPRVYGYLPLAAAFRSLSRPSSPPRAKASSMRPCSVVYTVQGLRLCLYFRLTVARQCLLAGYLSLVCLLG